MEVEPKELQRFYDHCKSMLYSKKHSGIGRYVLLDLINEQRMKCNVEIFLRKLESGSICADRKPYPRHLYLQDIKAYMNANKDAFPNDKLGSITIDTCTNGLDKDDGRLFIKDVIDGCLDTLGVADFSHISFSFIMSQGIFLTEEDIKELKKHCYNTDIFHVIKYRLGINRKFRLSAKPTGLSYSELRALLHLKKKKYSEMTTEQLMVLRNKMLFKLEDNVRKHIDIWETLMRNIEKVAEARNIELVSHE